jgi:DNA-binding CsgD family transcriptional regulator
VRDLSATLRRLPLPNSPALAEHISDLRRVLQAHLVMAYGVVDAGDRVDLAFAHGSGPADFGFAREAFARWLHEFPRKTGWAAYNAVLPEQEQRNRVIETGHLRTPIARELYPIIGLDSLDCVRVLVCEGPTMLAWVGIYEPGTVAPWQRSALQALVKPLRERLSVERKLERYAPTQAGLEAALECTPSPAFVLTGRGGVEPGNGLARAALRADRKGVVESLHAAVRGESDAGGYTITVLDNPGGQPWFLAVSRAPSTPLHRAKAAAATQRFALSERQSDILELLLQGIRSAEIARRLGISPSTLEKHLSVLYQRVEVDNRSALIARVTAL